MKTSAIKNAILAEMADGKTLLQAKLAVLDYFNERLEVAGQEVASSVGAK